ncbi:MAG: 30S ribosomal protein S9 [Minisyncoccia bacterium]
MAESKFISAVGRRKTAVAQVRLIPGKDESVVVNGMPAKDYFHTLERATIAEEALKAAELTGTYGVTARVSGGGKSAQAEAVRMGIARAATKENPNTRGTLKKIGFLKRDPRAKERKKPGLKKARKAPQWSKR